MELRSSTISERLTTKHVIMKVYKLVFSMTLILAALSSFAGGGAPPATPIDGGLSLLLAAGGAYGAKKLFDRRKK